MDDSNSEALALLKEAERLARNKRLYSTAPISEPASRRSLVDLLVHKNWARDTAQANLILLGVAVVACVLAGTLLLFQNRQTSSSERLTPDEVKQVAREQVQAAQRASVTR